MAGGLSLFQTRDSREGWALRGWEQRGWEQRVSGGHLRGALARVFAIQPSGADQ